MSERNKTVNAGALEQIVRRIVQVAEPERIIMFGSAAQGRMKRNSDVDLLVVKSGANRLKLAQRIYSNLHGVEEAVDVIVVTPEDVEKYQDSSFLVIASALKEGKVIYDGEPTTENTEAAEGTTTAERSKH